MYKIDLFISYAHIDNKPVAAEKSGWISRFHASLDTLLSKRLGKSVTIWRDDKLQGNDRFADEIVTQFQHTAVLVSVLTPRYLKSEWCQKEVNAFCERADDGDGLYVDQKARVFKIVKSPVDCQSQLPPVMQELLGYEFFTFEDGVPMELDDVYGEKYGQYFLRKVNKLAFEISELLKSLEKKTVSGSPSNGVEAESLPAAKEKPVVYLAECSFDMKDTREMLETELHCLGYQVLPDRVLPREEAAYEAAVSEMLSQCAVSVHLIGNYYGAVADGPGDKSMAVLQNEQAAKASVESGLKRLIWIEDGTAPEQENQKMFIDSLHNTAEAQQGADLLTGSIEHLKSALNATLNQIEKPSSAEADSELVTVENADEPLVYVICTEQDKSNTVPLRKLLKNSGFAVSMPAFKGDATEVRNINRKLLSTCDLVIVFYGYGEEPWKRSIDTELRKLPGYLNGRQPPVTFTFLAEPNTCDKDDMIEMEEPNLINGLDGLSADELKNAISLTVKRAPIV